jgi:ABC-type dipeptide/oligopeptide/nickel transport system permease subunit
LTALVRAKALAALTRDYVAAAKRIGASDSDIAATVREAFWLTPPAGP